MIALSGNSYADETGDVGKHEYVSNCAVCHGKSGKGGGPYAAITVTRIPVLTVLSKNNGGVFPFARVYATIDGTDEVKAHGTRDMPIWGTEYRFKGAEQYGELSVRIPESYVRARILALTEYIYRLQGSSEEPSSRACAVDHNWRIDAIDRVSHLMHIRPALPVRDNHKTLLGRFR